MVETKVWGSLHQLILLMFLFTFLASTGSLNHGRDAKPGEFPYVVRITISDVKDDAIRIAAGVLISLYRVLTTCDTVGYFSNETVHPHMLSRVLLLAGTVRRNGSEGQIMEPTSSSPHPWCHLLASGMVLFNLGFYEVSDGFVQTKFLKPLDQKFNSKAEALDTTYRLYQSRDIVKCYSAGWGYPTMAFEDQVEPDRFNSSSDVLQATEMTIVPYEGDEGCLATTCREFGDCLVNIWEYGLVCAAAKRGGPCRNDRGAPLICEGLLSGILTDSLRCEDRGIPRHFVRIDLVYDYVFPVKSAASFSSVNRAAIALTLIRLTPMKVVKI